MLNFIGLVDNSSLSILIYTSQSLVPWKRVPGLIKEGSLKTGVINVNCVLLLSSTNVPEV